MGSRKFSWPFFTFGGNKSCRPLRLWLSQRKSSQANATCMPWNSFSRLWGQGRLQLAFDFLAHWLQGIPVEEGDTPIRLYVFEGRPISPGWDKDLSSVCPECFFYVALPTRAGSRSYFYLYAQCLVKYLSHRRVLMDVVLSKAWRNTHQSCLYWKISRQPSWS